MAHERTYSLKNKPSGRALEAIQEVSRGRIEPAEAPSFTKIPEVVLTPEQLAEARTHEAETGDIRRTIPKKSFHGGSRRARGRIRSMLGAIGFPTNKVNDVYISDFSPRGSDYTNGIIPHAAYTRYEGAFRFMWFSDAAMTESTKTGLLTTTIHEGIHMASAFHIDNVGLYGGVEQMLAVTNLVIRIANQALETGIYLNWYHAELAQLYRENKISEEIFCDETQAILAQLYVTSRAISVDSDSKAQPDPDWLLRSVGQEQREALIALGKEADFQPLLTPEGSESLTGAEAVFAALLPENKKSTKKIGKHVDSLIKRFGGHDPLIKRSKKKTRK